MEGRVYASIHVEQRDASWAEALEINFHTELVAADARPEKAFPANWVSAVAWVTPSSHICWMHLPIEPYISRNRSRGNSRTLVVNSVRSGVLVGLGVD